VRVQVTQKHIDSGLRGSCSGDPICLAMKDAGLKNIWVSPSQLRYNGRTTEIPEEVLQFMKNFDNEDFVDPFEFDLEEA
jgi:hypothetical protein